MLSTRQSSNPHHQPSFPTRRSSDLQAIRDYGSDKPDTRFDMKIRDYTTRVQGQGFQVFDNSPFIGGLLLEEKADEYTNRLIKDITSWVQRPQVRSEEHTSELQSRGHL